MTMLSRRSFLASCTAPAFLASHAMGQKADRPNIVFLLADDHRADALGCMGNRIIQTPHLDALSARGARFENAFVTTAICVVSRASIFTGLYARNHGILRFQDSFTDDQFSRSYPALLKQAGYRSGFVGKWGLDGGKMPTQSFDYFRGFQGQGNYFPQNGHKGRHLTDTMGDQVLEFLDGCTSAQPFHLSVSFKAPHVQDQDPLQFLSDPKYERLYRDVEIPMPETASPQYISQLPLSVQGSEARRRWAVRFSTPELYQRSVKNYYRLITGIDEQVGRLVDALRLRGVAENTVIVYLGDNGFYLAEHGLAGKWFMHEESIRVPLLIADPRTTNAHKGVTVQQQALNIDIAPTLLAFAGIDEPAAVQGRSLVPLTRGQAPRWRQDWFYEHNFEHEWIPKSEGVRTTQWKYIDYHEESPRFEELYHLQADPKEKRNLALDAASAPRLKQMRDRRKQWLEALAKWAPNCDWKQLEPVASGALI